MKISTLICLSGLGCLCAGQLAAESVFDVSIDTAPLEGQAGYLVIDFIDGDREVNNNVIVTGLAGDAALGGLHLSGDSAGSLVPGPLELGDGEFFNSARQQLQFGLHLDFRLDVSAISDSTTVPDALAIFLLDQDQVPFASSDPTGADALLTIDINSDSPAPLIYESVFATVSLRGDLGIESIQADPDRLWPPDRRLHPIALTVDLSDGRDGLDLCQIVSVTANEPLAANDYQIDGPLSLRLRAWRLGSGDGRVYTIEVSCQSGGFAETGTVEVSVPHDRRSVNVMR